jgi:lipopolysaccharide transport system permease protein
LHEIWQYRDLLWRFVRRDLVANYQQTVLGPFWVFLQPVLTTLIYWLIFGRIAGISTDGIPPFLFYFPGIIIWSYFSDCLNGSMYTFLQNSAMFSKVYFPRMIMPVSTVIAHTVRMLIQLLLFVAVYAIAGFNTNSIHPSPYLLLLPLLVLLTAGFSLGVGLIISVITARYRDLDYAVQFLLRLFMFVTPVIYPASIVPENFRFLFWLNPLTAVIEILRLGFFSNGTFSLLYLFVSILSTGTLMVIGISFFKKKELQVIDII